MNPDARYDLPAHETEPCVGCGQDMPISSSTQVDTGSEVVTMCGSCQFWQGGRSCFVDPMAEHLPPALREELGVRHRPDCPERVGCDKRRTRTNLAGCPLRIGDVERHAKGPEPEGRPSP